MGNTQCGQCLDIESEMIAEVLLGKDDNKNNENNENKKEKKPKTTINQNKLFYSFIIFIISKRDKYLIFKVYQLDLPMIKPPHFPMNY